MIKITLGNNSNSEAFIVDLVILSNLFVSYVSNNQLLKLYEQIIINNTAINYLLICKNENVCSKINFTNVETYFYDNPASGSITNKKKLFACVSKNVKGQTQLIIIDDIFILASKLDKTRTQQFKNLLNYGSALGIHFIIGSVLPYKNLLKQLMIKQSGESKINNSPINELGAELIFNADGLLFFREKNIVDYTILYPIHNHQP